MDGAAIGGEIGGVSVRVPEQPEQIVGELARHLVHVNPNRRSEGVVRVSVHPPALYPVHRVVEVSDDDLVFRCTGGVVGLGFGFGDTVGEEVLQRGHEGGLGTPGRVGVRRSDSRGVREEEEEDGKGDEREGCEEEDWGPGSWAVLSCHFLVFAPEFDSSLFYIIAICFSFSLKSLSIYDWCFWAPAIYQRGGMSTDNNGKFCSGCMGSAGSDYSYKSNDTILSFY